MYDNNEEKAISKIKQSKLYQEHIAVNKQTKIFKQQLNSNTNNAGEEKKFKIHDVQYSYNELVDLLIRYISVYNTAIFLTVIYSMDDVIKNYERIKKAEKLVSKLLEEKDKNITNEDVEKLTDLMDTMHNNIYCEYKQHNLHDSVYFSNSFSKDALKYFEGVFGDGLEANIFQRLSQKQSDKMIENMKIVNEQMVANNDQELSIDNSYLGMNNEAQKANIQPLVDYIENGTAINEKDITAENLIAYLTNKNTFKNKGWWFTRIFSPKRARFKKLYKVLKVMAKEVGLRTAFKELRQSTKSFKKTNGKDNQLRGVIEGIFGPNIINVYSNNRNTNNNTAINGLTVVERIERALNERCC